MPMILNVLSSKGNVRIVETRLIVSVNRTTEVHRAQVYIYFLFIISDLMAKCYPHRILKLAWVDHEVDKSTSYGKLFLAFK